MRRPEVVSLRLVTVVERTMNIKKLGIYLGILLAVLVVAALIWHTPKPYELPANAQQNDEEAPKAQGVAAPVFGNVAVHDPAIVRVGETFYVFGSHLASAKSEDLMRWTQLTTRVEPGNVLIPNVKEELSEVLAWAETQTLWAPDVIQLEDGRFYKYYCACRGDSPRSGLGIAVSDNIEGPYKDLGIILKSGMWGEPSEDGQIYDANYHPNVVDPDVFFDSDGDLWMVYGSYSGGIFILSLDRSTGFPKPDQGYGKKLTGGYHARIEGPHILHNPDNGYYYLFLSYGGLAAAGGYNIRVARSRNPDGPYVDSMGNNMIDAKGLEGTIFHDPSIEPYGSKLVGNYRFLLSDGDPPKKGIGYVSPGHSSAYHHKDRNKFYLFFHTRFANRGEQHEVRVHQLFFNQDGWPVIAPFRYAGETIGRVSEDDLVGDWQVINHGRAISATVVDSTPIRLNADGSITGSKTGRWRLVDDYYAELTIGNDVYRGVFIQQWDTNRNRNTVTFSVLSEHKGIALWGNRSPLVAE